MKKFLEFLEKSCYIHHLTERDNCLYVENIKVVDDYTLKRILLDINDVDTLCYFLANISISIYYSK